MLFCRSYVMRQKDLYLLTFSTKLKPELSFNLGRAGSEACCWFCIHLSLFWLRTEKCWGQHWRWHQCVLQRALLAPLAVLHVSVFCSQFDRKCYGFTWVSMGFDRHSNIFFLAHNSVKERKHIQYRFTHSIGTLQLRNNY